MYPTVTVRANLELFAGLAGLTGRAATERIAEVADLLELDALIDRQARQLSGGEKRRLHTAMAMLHRPPLLMLDEPTTGVDIATRSRLLAAISRLAREEGCAVLYSTHYLPEVVELGASVAILDRGRIRARGALDDLVARHAVGVVDLTFAGPAPPIAGAEITGSDARLVTDAHPGPVAGATIGALGADAARLMSVVELLPGWAQAIAPATPAYWAMEGFRAVTLEPGGLADVVVPLLALTGFSVAFGLVALWRFDVEDTKVSWA